MDVIIVGQGLAGSCLAWNLHWSGQRVMLIDRNEPTTASKVAAGLMTPITGQRMTVVPYYRQTLALATSFYRRIERETQIELLKEETAVRLFRHPSERKEYETKYGEDQEFSKASIDSKGETAGIEMQQAGRLHAARFLKMTAEYFRGRGGYLESEVNVETDIEASDNGVTMPQHGLTAGSIVLCQGWQQKKSRWFSGLADGPSKGEIIRVRLKDYNEKRVVHKGVWLVPENGKLEAINEYVVGATYDRENLNQVPTAAGRAELLSRLKEITTEEPDVIGHVAAVRAGTKRRKPRVCQNETCSRVYAINGLGSRGALLAPLAAESLTAMMRGTPIDDFKRQLIDFFPDAMCSRPSTVSKAKSLTQMAHTAVRRIVRTGDTVIDATAGNGHDTLFLAKQAGGTGTVIGIDIQAKAIEMTRKKLQEAGYKADLRLSNHAEELASLEIAGVKAKAVMFNLGYLPGADKTITTEPDTTSGAIAKAAELLVPGGLLTVIAYRGHAGGQNETEKAEQTLSSISKLIYECSRIEGDPQNSTSPVLFMLRRKSLSK